MITQKELKELLHYDPSTGIFIWLIKPSCRVVVGAIAGYKTSFGYIHIRTNGKRYFAHRLAWLYMHGVWPTDQIDHINHIRNDNRIENLRNVTGSENGRNRSLSKKNISGVNGVYWHRKINKWQVQMNIFGKNIYLGSFHDRFEAICARKSAEKGYGFHENHGK